MRWFLVIMLALNLTSCSIREREKEIERKTMEINQREQELLFREKSLALKEEELLRRESAFDSLHKRDSAIVDSLQGDSITRVNPRVAGTWSVKMTCTETSCSGSAIGDTRNEQWEITIQDDAIIARAMSNNKLVRTYTGNSRGGLIYLTTQQEALDTEQAVRMIVRLQETRNNEMEGRREIIRTDECRILYKLELKKL